MEDLKQVEVKTDDPQTSSNLSTVSDDISLLLALVFGAAIRSTINYLKDFFKKSPTLNTTELKPNDNINYLLHKLIIESDNDGVMIALPDTIKVAFKPPVSTLQWVYFISKPNVELEPPHASAKDLALLSDKKWVEITSTFGYYFFKTVYYDGLIAAHIVVFDSTNIDAETLKKTNTKQLETLIKELIEING